MSDHLGDSASLYALGALDAAERAEADAHLAHCDACVRLVAQSEATVAAMTETQPQHEAPAALDARVESLFATNPSVAPSKTPSNTHPLRPNNAWFSAVAAVLVVAFLPSAILLRENVRMHDAMAVDASAMARMTSGPHRMVAFTGTGTAVAKVVYGPNGSWYCVIVKGATAPLHVMWPHDGQETALGMTESHGDVAMLYLPESHRMDQLTLSDGQHVVGEAKLVF